MTGSGGKKGGPGFANCVTEGHTATEEITGGIYSYRQILVNSMRGQRGR
jgi:hypothetical protein